MDHMLRALGSLIAAFAALAAAGLLLLGARAAGGVPIPAETGTRWEIVAGYNTGTHNWNDQQDPHAIDIVRIDADTAGSAVLAPTSGSISYASSDCLSIRDAADMEHLLCHIQPADGLRRGSAVEIGQRVGTVWGDGLGNNGGLAHIHYAVHHSRGSGYMGETVPFTGAYAIEDIELRDGDAFNLHAGVDFTSSNRPGWQAPPVTRVSPENDQGGEPAQSPDDGSEDGDEDGGAAAAANGESGAEDDHDDQSEQGTQSGGAHSHADGHDHGHDHDHGDEAAVTAVARRSAAQPVIGGWRAIAIDRPTSLAAVWSKRGSTLTALHYWDRFRQRWLSYSPMLPGGAVAGTVTLSPGDAVLGAVQDAAAWLPRILHAPAPPALRLSQGWNLVSWHAETADAADAFQSLNSLAAAHLWDNEQQRYLRWSPDAAANSLETIPAGASLWLRLGEPETWVQSP